MSDGGTPALEGEVGGAGLLLWLTLGSSVSLRSGEWHLDANRGIFSSSSRAAAESVLGVNSFPRSGPAAGTVKSPLLVGFTALDPLSKALTDLVAPHNRHEAITGCALCLLVGQPAWPHLVVGEPDEVGFVAVRLHRRPAGE